MQATVPPGSDGRQRPPSLLALPSYLASKLGRIGHRVIVEVLAEHRLAPPHFAVLSALADFGPLAQRDLASALDLQSSHLVRYLDELEQRALVRRERDPDDRRRHRVALTASGTDLVDTLGRATRRSQEKFLAALSTAERETLMALLQRLVVANDQVVQLGPDDPCA